MELVHKYQTQLIIILLFLTHNFDKYTCILTLIAMLSKIRKVGNQTNSNDRT